MSIFAKIKSILGNSKSESEKVKENKFIGSIAQLDDEEGRVYIIGFDEEVYNKHRIEEIMMTMEPELNRNMSQSGFIAIQGLIGSGQKIQVIETNLPELFEHGS